MKFTLLGTRGSRPVIKKETFKYGGNTTSYKIEIEGMPPIYIDGGTGLFREGRRISSDLKSNKITEFRAYFLVTHTHWDHILSFPFFKPFYRDKTQFTVYGPASSARNWEIEDLFNMQHRKGLFPVPFELLRKHLRFVDVKPGKKIKIEKAEVKTMQLNHQGLTIGYRIKESTTGKSIAVITDNAPVEDGNFLGVGMNYSKKDWPKRTKEFNNKLVRFLKDTDLVLQDTHFTHEGIKGRENWGHSTPDKAVEFSARAGVKTLILGHHAPEDDDKDVKKKLQNARKLARNTFKSDLKVILVRERETICL
ncbi:MBL fold metallo-hydrolase [Candidatus Riflebacteria bacterium]